MRLASFNLENLFSRPVVMNRDTWADGREVLSDVDRLNTLLAKEAYSAADRRNIESILNKYEFWNRNKSPDARGFIIQQVREKLYKIPRGQRTVEVVADGRDAWVGWVELTRRQLPGAQVDNTGRVLEEVAADVACIVECENRFALDRFNEQVLGPRTGGAFAYDMLIDGNDPRGIDLGLLSRFPITSMCSHIHRADNGGNRVFSRDCAEYEITMPDDSQLWVLCNHFKSKGYGSQASSNARRAAQAAAVKEIYEGRRTKHDLVAVCGDLNDTPESAPLAQLVQHTDLRDISTHARWQGPTGTYGAGTAKGSKIDYILLSPDLWRLVRDVGAERRGIYAPRSITSFPGVTRTTAASDHAALWVDLDLGN